MGRINESHDRHQYLDILRVAATCFVILLHCISSDISDVTIFGTRTWWACNLINSVTRTGVPLFFMISGYLLLNSEKTLHISDFYKKRFSRVLIPFLAWDIIYFINRYTDNKETSIADFFRELLVRGSSYHLWFVYTLIGIYLFMPFIKRITDNSTFKQVLWLLILIMFAGTIRPFINTITPIYIFLFDSLAEGYLGYVILGYILGKYDTPKSIRVIIYLGGLVGLVIGVYGNYIFSSYEKINLYFNGGYQINHFLCAAALFTLAKNMKPLKNRAMRNIITSVSHISFGVYLCHALILSKLQNNLSTGNPAVDILVYFFLTTLISTAFMFALSKIKHINRIFI